MYRRSLLSCLLLPALVVGGCESKKSKDRATQVVVETPTQLQAPEQAAPQVVVTGAQGNVEIRSNEVWRKANVGDTLGLDDALRAEGGASANLQLGDVSVTLEPRSEVTVREMTAELAELRLERGLIAAKVSGGGTRRLRVQAAGSTAVAEAGHGKGAFTVFNDGKGLVAVAPTVGEVKLTSSGGDANLAAGQRGTVVDDKDPVVDQVPGKVLLSVNWPDEEFATPRDVVLRGTVEASTLVEVNGTQVPVDRDGSFVASVGVKRGKTSVEINAVDSTGRKTSKQGTIEVSPPTPGAKADGEGIWK